MKYAMHDKINPTGNTVCECGRGEHSHWCKNGLEGRGRSVENQGTHWRTQLICPVASSNEEGEKSMAVMTSNRDVEGSPLKLLSQSWS